MKKIFLVVFSLCSILSFAQTVNDYEFVMVPTQFGFQQSENEYRLNVLFKYRLEEYGFNASYTDNKISYNDRCAYLTAAVIDNSNLRITKVIILFKNCEGAIIFESQEGKSKIKERNKGYTEALEEALESVKALNYKFAGNKATSISQVLDVNAVKSDMVGVNVLFAQPIDNGFQLIDTTPKVVLKLFKTSKNDFFIARSDLYNGVVFQKGSQWFFEYYVKDTLFTEQLSIRF
jgi:hypothetical protein